MPMSSLGAWQNGLIVLHDGKPQSVGESQIAHNLYPLKARLLEGPPLHRGVAAGGHARAQPGLAALQDRTRADLLPVG